MISNNQKNVTGTDDIGREHFSKEHKTLKLGRINRINLEMKKPLQVEFCDGMFLMCS